MLEFVRRIARRLGMLIRRGEREHAMDEEMSFHIDMEAAELQRNGLPVDEARRQARLVFGGVERFKEEGRDARGTRLIEDLWQDLRYAVRQLRASPGFAAATVVTLALGIGATTTMHSFRRYMTSQENTLASPERLLYLGQGPRECSRCVRMAAGNYLTIRNQARTLEHVSMFADWDPILRGPDRAELLDGVRVTTEFFRTLDIRPMLGRVLVPDDSVPGREHVVVLSERMWRTRFEGDSAALGRTIVLDRIPYAIVGVVPNTAMYPLSTDFWTPLSLTPTEASERQRTDYRVVGRLREGVTAPRAAAEVAGIAARTAADFPEVMGGSTFAAVTIPELHRPDRDPASWAFTGAVSLVLLIACINLAGLLIARLSARRRELAVRRAMGAAPVRIVRQLLAETMLLTALGGAAGAIAAAWGIRALVGWSQISFDVRAFGVAMSIGLLSGVAIGLWPALRFARPRLVDELRDVTRTATGSIDRARGRRALVVAEIALAIVLLSAAGLLARSVQKIYAIDPGFDTDRLLAVRVQNPPQERNAPAHPERIDRLVQEIAAVPGVERAGATLGLPFGQGMARSSFEIEGRPPFLPDERPTVRMQPATPGYFETLGIPIVRGRAFADADRAGAPRVAIINRVVAQRFFPGEDPIGRAVIIDSVRWEIVGVAGNVFYGDVDQLTAPEIYRPMQQWGRSTVWIAARTRGDPAQVGPAVTAAIRRFDPDIAITRLFTMNALRVNDMGSERRMLRLMGGFALAALLISAIGLYGLISYSVAQRTREFGVRLALGANRAAVLKLVLSQGLRLAAIGATLGIAGALGALRVMQSMLFSVSPADPLTLGLVVVTICAIALLAAYVPARRAMLVDPMTALREE